MVRIVFLIYRYENCPAKGLKACYSGSVSAENSADTNMSAHDDTSMQYWGMYKLLIHSIVFEQQPELPWNSIRNHNELHRYTPRNTILAMRAANETLKEVYGISVVPERPRSIVFLPKKEERERGGSIIYTERNNPLSE